MTPELAQAIDEFIDDPMGEYVADPDQADGMCGQASGKFIRFLAERGIDAQAVRMDGIAGEGVPLFPWTERGEQVGHTVVLVEGYYVDWTARQYDPYTDCPALIEPWPNCRPVEIGDDGWIVQGGA